MSISVVQLCHQVISDVIMNRIFTSLLFLLFVQLFTLNVWAATFTVVTTSDSEPGSLRAALIAANVTCDFDEINFNIPASMMGVDGAYSIKPLTNLPSIECPVKIDGYTQPGSDRVTGSPLVELNGEKLLLINNEDSALRLLGRDLITGAVLSKSASGSIITGLVINKFPVVAFRLFGVDNVTIIGNY